MTMQAREILVYRGQPREMRALPLQNCGRPVPDFQCFSTGCHRGYVGTWEIRDDALHLIRLDPPARGELDDRDRLIEMFPEANGSVEARWFSGEIIADDLTDPKDEEQIERNVANGWPSHFLRFTLIIHRGKLLSEVTTDLQRGVTEARLTRHVEGLFPVSEVAFLNAIHSDLDDRTAKLVYADWLEDRDDPRAARLREEVARQQKEGPGRTVVDGHYHWRIPSGYVAPDDLLWFWYRLADIPEPTSEERKYREFLRRMEST